jgi:hypothetical protein
MVYMVFLRVELLILQTAFETALHTTRGVLSLPVSDPPFFSYLILKLPHL